MRKAGPLGTLAGQFLSLGIEKGAAVIEVLVRVVEALDGPMLFLSRRNIGGSEDLVIGGQRRGRRHGYRKREYPRRQTLHKNPSSTAMPTVSSGRRKAQPLYPICGTPGALWHLRFVPNPDVADVTRSRKTPPLLRRLLA